MPQISAPLPSTVNVPLDRPAAPEPPTLPISCEAHGEVGAVLAGVAAKITADGGAVVLPCTPTIR